MIINIDDKTLIIIGMIIGIPFGFAIGYLICMLSQIHRNNIEIDVALRMLKSKNKDLRELLEEKRNE